MLEYPALADTSTPNVLLTNQTEGGNNNSWGAIADTNFETIDNKFGDVTSISTTGGNTTLTDNQEIVAAIAISGTLVSNATIIFSGRGGYWIVSNNTTGSFSVTCKKSGQTGVTIEQGGAALVYFNGTDIAYGNPPAAATAEVTVASATTCDVLGAASEFVAISGTTTVTSFGTGTNRKRFCRATGAFKITHNATSLICPGGQDITTAAGDTWILVSDSSSNVRVLAYQRAANPPATLPVGASVDYWGTTAPPFYLFPYGQNVSRTTYAALFAALSTTYGVGDGSTTFGLPDCRGRARVGKDNMGGSSADRLTNQSGGLDGDTLGATGGAETHTLSTAQLPVVTPAGSISVSVTNPNVTDILRTSGAKQLGTTAFTDLYNPTVAGMGTITATATFSGTSFGSGSAHNNVQPSIVCNVILYAGTV